MFQPDSFAGPGGGEDQHTRFADWRARVASTLAVWNRRARTRRELARLGPRECADIGIRLECARREAAKPFWRE